MAEEDEEVKKTEDEEAPEKPSGGAKRLIIIVVLLLVFLGAQIGIGIIIAGKLKPEDPALKALEAEQRLQKEAKIKLTQMGMTLEAPIEVTANVAETNGERFVVCTVQLEWDGDKYPGLSEEIEARIAKIKNLVINIVSSKPLIELQSREGKTNLTNAIVADVNSILPEGMGEIRSCFLDKFIIQ
jgi:flagellar FliL protein